MTPGLETEIVNQDAYSRSLNRLREKNVVLPRISDLADPTQYLSAKITEIADVDPDAADPRNLFRVNWHNSEDRRGLAV